jgi:uncharacterized protein YbjT (DUF2867 family)
MSLRWARRGGGGELSQVLLRKSWTIRALTRDPAKAAKGRNPAIQWVQGDAMDAEAVI